jgi:preprotein translocase subunit SecA
MRKNPFKRIHYNKYQDLIGQINILEDSFKALNDSELRAKSFKLKRAV